MKKEDIITLPHSALRTRSKKVGLITPEIKKIISDMEAATLDWEASRDHEVGVALAAVQVNILYRIIVIRNDFNNKDDHSFSVFINPQITKYEGKVEEDFEGCLSIRDVYGKVPRYAKVRIKALDQDGKEIRLTAEGFLARIFQHEIDHTNGIAFIDHIRDETEAFYRLMPNGHLEKLDYDKDIKDNQILWADVDAEAGAGDED
jgi:peptide deformylase